MWAVLITWFKIDMFIFARKGSINEPKEEVVAVHSAILK